MTNLLKKQKSNQDLLQDLFYERLFETWVYIYII